MAATVGKPRGLVRTIRRADCGHMRGFLSTCESCGAIMCRDCRHIVEGVMLCDACVRNRFLDRRLRSRRNPGGDVA